MASRSTRRRLKNPEMPKLDGCQNEEEAQEENQSTIGRRRSLRHSPGTSSLSPPLKTRRIKESPNTHETKSIKSSPTKSPKSPIKPFYHEIKELREESNQDVSVEIIATRKSTRHNQVGLNSSPTRMTRNNSVPSITPTKRNTSVRTANVSESTSVSPRRNTRSKANSPCDKEVDVEQNLKDNLVIKPRKGRLAPNTTLQEETSVQAPSTSVGRKRNLTHSPEVLGEAKNGTSSKSTSPKRKRLYRSPEHEISVHTNGKAVEIEFDETKENKLKNLHTNSDKASVSSDTTATILINKTSLLSSAFHNRLNQHSDLEVALDTHVKDEEGKDSSKRRLSNDSSESEIKQKRSKYNEVLNSSQPSISTSLSEKKSNAQTAGTIDKRPVHSVERSLTNSIDGSTLIEMMDTYSNAESLLLKEFTLTESQCNEVCKILSPAIKDSSHVVIVEELVKKLLKESTSISSMSSPRFNKFLRQLLVKYCNFDTSVEKKHLLCESALVWSKERKSVNLRHELELALMTLYYNTGFYRKAEEMATGLYKETKKLQDKEKTVKACLCLSKAYHAMGNISKARANITTAKTEALKIYTPPDLQGELDLQSGIMQVAEEKDMETAFSYFKEAATGFTVRANRSRALKYMLLTKLLLNRPDDGEKAVRSQCHVEDIDDGVEAMLSITKAAVSCSLAEFKKAREQYGSELEDDLVVNGVLDQLYSKMLEKNLLNIIAPYERMQISVVAEKIGLGREEVERRLSQMILDGQISAQLDHRDDCLYVYRGEGKDQVYENAIESISQFDRTLSLLNRRIKQLL